MDFQELLEKFIAQAKATFGPKVIIDLYRLPSGKWHATCIYPKGFGGAEQRTYIVSEAAIQDMYEIEGAGQ